MSFDKCNVDNSGFNFEYINVKINQSKFNNSLIIGHSNNLKLTNSKIINQKFALSIIKTFIEDSSIINASFDLYASYFSIGVVLDVKNTTLTTALINVSPDFRSCMSQLNFENSKLYDLYINAGNVAVLIKNTTLNESYLFLSFSSLNVSDTLFYSDKNIEDIIKTKVQGVDDVYIGGEITTEIMDYHFKTNFTVLNSYLIKNNTKFLIDNDSISKDTTYIFTCQLSDLYCVGDKIIFKLIDSNERPVEAVKIYIKDHPVYYADEIETIYTNKSSMVSYTIKRSGKYEIKAYYYSNGIKGE